MALKEVVMDDLNILFGHFHLPPGPDENNGNNKKLEIHDILIKTEHSTLLNSCCYYYYCYCYYYYYYYCYYYYYYCFWYNSIKLILSLYLSQ